MPLILKVMIFLMGGLYLVDQSQILCSDDQCNGFSVTTQNTPSTDEPENPSLIDHTLSPDTGLALNQNPDPQNTDPKNTRQYANPIAEGGIEGTGFIHTEDQQWADSSLPLEQIKNDETIAEGGIEGTGIYNDIEDADENSGSTHDNPGNQHNSDEDGIEGTGIIAEAEDQLVTYGPITQFGSIYVNGSKYEIDDAEVEFVNNTGANELAIGMMVQVQADWKQQINGVFNAQKVTFDQQIEGPINTVAGHGDTTILTILGTTVVVTDDTAIDNSITNNFIPGSVVSVSGISNEKGQLQATYITLRTNVYRDGQQVEVENIVTAINELEQMINLDGIKVDVSKAKWKKGTLETLEIGVRIEVVGHYDANNNRIIANKVRVKENDLSLNKGNKLILDTIVTHYQSINQFRLNGYTTNASAAEFLRGESQDLSNGVRIRATGYINIDGIFEVQTLRIKSKSNFAVKVQVNSVNSATGEIGFLSQVARTQSDTVYQSKLKAPNKYFSINDIKVDDWIEIQGAEESGQLSINNLFALRNKQQMIIKGHVTTDNNKLFLLGIEIQPMESVADELIASIKAGDMIVAKGTLFDDSDFNSGVFYARELVLR